MDQLHGLRTMHLFCGAGGGVLADLILGHRPVCAVEIEPYCQRVLEQRQKDGLLPWFPIWDDVRTFDGSPWHGLVDMLCMGFPCTDISTAGKQTGIHGEKSSLFFQALKAVDAIQPEFIFLENSPNIRTKGRREVVAELVARGYSWRDGTLAASDFGAGHKRNRWWLLAANTNGKRKLQSEWAIGKEWGWDNNCSKNTSHINRESGWRGQIETVTSPEDSSDSLHNRLQIAIQQGWLDETSGDTIEAVAGYTSTPHWSSVDSCLRGVVDGIPYKLDGNKTSRIKALGNAQVPVVAATAFLILSKMFTKE